MNPSAPAPVAVLLAAGASRRFGRLKQLEPLGPSGEALLDYSIHDALVSGFRSIVLVVRPDILEATASHVDLRWRGVPLRFALQTLEAGVPGDVRPREVPWGTGHAVIAAAQDIDGPFAVANADDFYGRDGWRAASAWLATRDAAADTAIIVYPLERTLSPHGGVSRAVCDVGDDGRVRAVREMLDVRRAGPRITGHEEGGAYSELTSDVPVSMNLWCFDASVVPLLEERFVRFALNTAAEPAAEFRLSTEIDALRHDGHVRIRAVETNADWFGVTHPEDAARVRSRLDQLVAASAYPEQLGVEQLEPAE